MTIQKLIKEQLEGKCKKCKIKECNGITITQDGVTKCAKEEKSYGTMFNE